MRIAWFTPFSERGIVARFSAIVTRELSRYADVDIWHPPEPRLQSTVLRTIAMPRSVRVSPAMLDSVRPCGVQPRRRGRRPDRGGGVHRAGRRDSAWSGSKTAVRRAYAVVVHSEFTRAFATRLSLAPVAMISIAQESAGGKARSFARMAFGPRKYAQALLSLTETVLPVAPMLECVDAMAGRLAEIGVEAGAPVVDRVAQEAYSLFGGGASSSRR